MYELQDIWDQFLTVIEGELPSSSFNTWIKPIKPICLTQNEIVLSVPIEFIRNMLVTNYASKFEKILTTIASKPLKPHFILESEVDSYQKAEEAEPSSAKSYMETTSNGLIKKYTFDNFIVGNSNNFAQAASMAVAENPAQAYNPLFLYGGSGLGKTHLMHAIGNHILMMNPMANIMYVTSERFTNELINAIKEQNTETFKARYRMVDVLLIDDIQFIGGKESTQEEFFHTFNHLQQANKQIIISSDRPPKEIEKLEERLRTRFEGGLICDVKPPTYETRLAILQNKAQQESISVPYDVLDYIANKIDSNIRELEGALNKIKAFSELGDRPITLEIATTVLHDYSIMKKKIFTQQDIQKHVAEYYGIPPEDLISKKKNKEIAFPRQVAMYICRNLLDDSFPKIGQEFGGRDHSTVMHNIKKIELEIKTNPTLRNTVNTIIKNIEEN